MYLGQKPIGEKCLKILSDAVGSNINISAVVSNPLKESVWWGSNAGYEYAERNRVPFISNIKRNIYDIRKCISDNNINFLISVGHNWIVDEETLELVKGNAVNLHLAILPAYQGNFTFNHAILNHDIKYGITLHFMQKEVDTGDYIIMPTFDINNNDTAYSLYCKAVNLGVQSFKSFVDLLDSGKTIPRHRLVGTPVFYDRHSIDGKREISDTGDVREVETKARAFYFPPFEKAYFKINNCKYYIEPEVRDD